MNTHTSIRPLIVTLLLIAGISCPTLNAKSKGGDKKEVTLAAVYTAEQTAPLKELTTAAQQALSTNNKEVLAAKLTALKTAWDGQANTLKPLDKDTWKSLDKMVNKTVTTLSEGSEGGYNPKKGKKSLKKLADGLDQATKQ